MNEFYNIYTSISINEIDILEHLEILKFEKCEYRIKDPFGNYLWIDTKRNGVPIKARVYGQNDPIWILYDIVTVFKAEVLGEEEIIKLIEKTLEISDPNYYKKKERKHRKKYTKSIIDCVHNFDPNCIDLPDKAYKGSFSEEKLRKLLKDLSDLKKGTYSKVNKVQDYDDVPF